MTFDGSPVYSFSNIDQFTFDGEAGNDSIDRGQQHQPA